ncbi:MAG: transporter substrate-binding domain-containing protein [Bermanella sp.]
MSQNILKTLSLIFLVLLSLGVAAKDTVTIGSGEWIPLTGENIKHGGFCGHVVSEAFKLAGYDVQFNYAPWKRVITRLKQGVDDSSLCWIKNAEREEFFLYSDTIMVQKKVFFHRKDFNFDWNSLDDLGQYKIGSVRGWSLGEELDKAQKEGKINVNYTNSDVQNFKKLLLGRIDLYPSELVVGYTTMQKITTPANMRLITNHKKPIIESSYYLILSKKIPKPRLNKLLIDFNRGLKLLKDSGQYEKMEEAIIDGYYTAEK